MKLRIVAVVVLSLQFCTVGQAKADMITTLFSTGVDAGGAVLSNGSIDPHYTMSGGGLGPDAYVIGNPAGVGWVGNTAGSTWISGARDTFSPAATDYMYTTTFDLTGFNPNSASISGIWSADDNLTDVLLNGNSVGSLAYPGWTALHAFSITSGFQNGINTLTFLLPNEGGPQGLQVQMVGTADVPEPGTLALLAGFGATGLCFIRRRK